jgi:hypothetical protein
MSVGAYILFYLFSGWMSHDFIQRFFSHQCKLAVQTMNYSSNPSENCHLSRLNHLYENQVTTYGSATLKLAAIWYNSKTDLARVVTKGHSGEASLKLFQRSCEVVVLDFQDTLQLSAK